MQSHDVQGLWHGVLLDVPRAVCPQTRSSHCRLITPLIRRWQPHGSGWYSCNRYDDEAAKRARDAQEKSRAALARHVSATHLLYLPIHVISLRRHCIGIFTTTIGTT